MDKLHATPINATENSSARLSALTALSHTLDKQKPLDSAWAQDRYFQNLSPSDRGFAQLVAKTTLRRLGQIDALLAQFIDRPLGERNVRVMHALRMGVAQLIWLETPPHAAVHATVELTKQIRMEKYSGLVNAILKRIAKEGKSLTDAQDATKINTPEWLWNIWLAAYGEEKTRALCAIHLQEPPLDISVKSDPAKWAETLKGTVLPTGSVRLTEARNLTQLPGFAEGEWWVQDMAATLPAKLLGNVRSQRVIDLCAAPGGKTAQLAVAGAKVSAVDMSKDRIAMLKTNVHRLQLQAEYITTDASKWIPAFAPDAILLDAPCSATGTLRRHPDVAHLRKPADIERLIATQSRLLHHALDTLKVGGKLVYSVCSLQPQEGEDQITTILEQRNDIELVAVDAATVGGMSELLTKRGEVRSLPCHLSSIGGIDGFFAAVLKKKG